MKVKKKSNTEGPRLVLYQLPPIANSIIWILASSPKNNHLFERIGLGLTSGQVFGIRQGPVS
jgi:hypothetical protein